MFKAQSALYILTALFFVAACSDDNPVNEDRADEHAEAFGFVLYNSGVELVRYEQGAVSGEVEVGLEKETALLSVRFLNEEGALFSPATDDGYSLGWDVADKAIAEIEWHEDDGMWSFHIVGEGIGETTIVIKLNHNGHADFVALPFAVRVTESGPGEDHEDE